MGNSVDRRPVPGGRGCALAAYTGAGREDPRRCVCFLAWMEGRATAPAWSRARCVAALWPLPRMWRRPAWPPAPLPMGGHGLDLLGRFWAVPVSRMAGRIWGTAWIAAQFQAVGAVPWLPMLELAVRIRAAVPVSLVWMETGTRWPCAQIGHIPRCCPAGARPQCRLPYPVCLNFPIGEFFSHTRGHGVSVDLFLKLFWGGGRVSPYGATRAHMATCGCAPAHKRPSADVASHKKTCEKSAKKPPLFCIS